MQRQAGNIVLVLVLALFALGLVGGAFMAFRGDSSEDPAAAHSRALFEEMKARVGQVMERPDLVANSVERNPNSFACFYSSAAACRGAGGPLLLYEDSSQTAAGLSQLVAGTGFSADGSVCRGFPSPTCSVRVETRWQPVCAGANCENTRSFKLQALVLHHDGSSQPDKWEKVGTYNPDLKLSQAVTCERGGGVWAGTECLTHDQAASRLAQANPREPSPPGDRGVAEAMLAFAPPAAPEASYVCPDAIPIQGQYYTLERIAPNRELASAGPTTERGQVSVPAMNGCAGEDRFVFQCQAKHPAQFEGEGQWVQVEAEMFPSCGVGDGSLAPPSGGYSRQ